jgi:hypothetical protein
LRSNVVEEEQEVKIHVFPNPQSQGSGVKILVSHPATVLLYSVKGQKLPLNVSLIPNQETYMPLFNLAAGLYILRFEIGNKSYTRKLVVY